MNKEPIGIFDSGVGGLTVARRIMEELPEEQIIYFGDTARLPYGSKTKETVTKFSKQIIHFLQTKKVKAIIVACNTVSSNSIDDLKEAFDLPIMGVVRPGVHEAVKATKNKRVGIIGTNATIKSGAYERLICNEDSEIKVYTQACPLFVPLVEEGWGENEVTSMVAKTYLTPLIQAEVDSIVLGCTHYPLLKRCLKRVVGDSIQLVDPAYATALLAKETLEKAGQLSTKREKNHIFYVSDLTDNFNMICQAALGQIYPVEKIDIEQY